MSHSVDDSSTTRSAPKGRDGVAQVDGEVSAVPTFRFALGARRLLAVNDAAVARYGWSRGEFLKMSADDLQPPEQVDRFHRLIEWLISHGQRPLGGCHLARHRRREGTPLDVEVTWSAVARRTDPTAWTFARPIPKPVAPGATRVKAICAELEAIQRANTLAAALRAAAGAARRLVGAKLVVFALEAPREAGAPPAVPPGSISLALSGKDSEDLGRIVVVKATVDSSEASAILALVSQSAACWLTLQRMQREQRAQETHVRTLSRRAAAAREEERAHIARELHDDLGGILTGACMLLDDPRAPTLAEDEERRAEALRLVSEAIRTVRDLSHALRPLDLEERGLRAAIEDHVARWRRRGGLGVHLDYEGGSRSLPPAVALIAFRIVQEGLTNVVRHAGPTDVVVRVRETPRSLTVDVLDRGTGFDAKNLRGLEGSGIRGLRERVRYVGGRFVVTSAPGRGTRLSARLPLRRMRGRRRERVR